MYKAKISSIAEQSVSNDTVNVDVTYYNGEKEFTKSYNLHASSFKTTTDLIAFIDTECKSLDSFSSVVEIVKPLVGVEDIVAELKK